MEAFKAPQGRVRRFRTATSFQRWITLLLLPLATSALVALTLPSIAMAQGSSTAALKFNSGPIGTQVTATTASTTSLTTRAAGHLQPVRYSSVYAPVGPYMAAAFSQSKAIAGFATGDTQSDAEYNALTYCGQVTGNTNCQGAEWVLHGWLALAFYNTGTASKPNIRAWAVEPGQTAQGAKNNAVSLCDYIAGSNVCTYIGEGQSPSTTKPYAYGGPSVGANDYPTFLATPPQDSVNPDPWGFLNRECTSFVAWRINDNNGVRFSNNMTGLNGKAGHFGFAYQWRQNALNIGYTYSTTPTARSIAWWGPNYHGAGGTGHVAYVDSVTMNGSTVAGITIEQYNWGIPGSYSTTYIPVGAGDYPEGFIHGLEGGRLVGP